ncbi:MAG: choline dehydrogenase [Rickettsiales bacterium]|nr:choline dehydrogenase [Rickettsiales bacterium]
MNENSGQFDYIVIGAGSAGAVVANRVSADPNNRVLVLEAGGTGHFWSRIPIGYAKLIDNPVANWCYESEPDEGTGDRRIPVPRGKLLGGSSSINGMVFVRGQAQDYDHWAQLGNRGWSYKDVLPIFKNMESYDGGDDEYRGRDGLLRVTDTDQRGPLYDALIAGAEAIGLPYNPDYNGAQQEGVAMTQTTISGGRRMSTARAYLEPAQNRPNLKIQTGALTERLIFDGKRCVGVRYSIGGTVHEARATREVMLSAGSINSPQLLELSGIGNPEILKGCGVEVRHALPGVGENLRDHYSPRMRYKISQANWTYAVHGRGMRLAGQVLKYITSGSGLLSMTAVPIRTYFKTREGLETPDATASCLPFWVEDRKKISAQPGLTLNVNVLRSDSRGSIHIGSSEPQKQPKIKFNFLSSELDRTGLLAAMRKGRKWMGSEPLKKVISEECTPGADLQKDDELLEWVRNNAETTYHPVGTCKMGQDDMAVVDDRLRVRGIVGLRVADASVMPTLTSGNTNAPSIMIGEKASMMMLEDAR